MTDQLPERISAHRPDIDVAINADVVGYKTDDDAMPGETLYLRADTAMPRAEADAMVAAAFEQAQHTAQIAWDWPESEASSAPVCEAIAKLTPADARAAFEQAVRGAAEAAYIEGGKAAREDHAELVREAVEAERARVVRLAANVCSNLTKNSRAVGYDEGWDDALDIAEQHILSIRAPQETSE